MGNSTVHHIVWAMYKKDIRKKDQIGDMLFGSTVQSLLAMEKSSRSSVQSNKFIEQCDSGDMSEERVQNLRIGRKKEKEKRRIMYLS